MGRPWSVSVLACAALLACTRPNPAFRIRRGDAAATVDGPDQPPPGESDAAAPPDGNEAPTDGNEAPPDGSAPDRSTPSDLVARGDATPDLPLAPVDAADPRPASGMVAFWPFDQPPASGVTTVMDRFGNSAILHGGLSWSTDVPPIPDAGRALQLDGSGAYLDLSLAASQRPTSQGAKTVALWFKSTSSTPTERTMVVLFNAAELLDVGIQLGWSGTRLAAWRYGRSAELVGGAAQDQWHHGAYTYASGLHILYLDGIEQARLTGHDPVSGTLDSYKVGTYDQTLEPTKYQGLISDLRIYTRALTASEVATLAGK
jgi:hypothetical protein